MGYLEMTEKLQTDESSWWNHHQFVGEYTASLLLRVFSRGGQSIKAKTQHSVNECWPHLACSLWLQSIRSRMTAQRLQSHSYVTCWRWAFPHTHTHTHTHKMSYSTDPTSCTCYMWQIKKDWMPFSAHYFNVSSVQTIYRLFYRWRLALPPL